MMIRGPWRIDKMNSEGIEIVDDVGNLVHLWDFGSIPGERGAAFAEEIIKEETANCRLIAAAPELLAALKEARQELEKIRGGEVSGWNVVHAIRVADTAIGKAERE